MTVTGVMLSGFQARADGSHMGRRRATAQNASTRTNGLRRVAPPAVLTFTRAMVSLTDASVRTAMMLDGRWMCDRRGKGEEGARPQRYMTTARSELGKACLRSCSPFRERTHTKCDRTSAGFRHLFNGGNPWVGST